MAVKFKYWDDCIDPEDMEAMWMDLHVRTEWINAGEIKRSKVHLSRDPDGHPYLTQIEMKAVARIIISRHFVTHIDSDMVSAIAELESARQPLATRYNKNSKEIYMGIMQILPKTAELIFRELGYETYEVLGDPKLLYKPFVNVYLGVAYLKWLSNYNLKERSEEFMVRSYKGGTKKASRRSTLAYWKLYLSTKESLPSRKLFKVRPSLKGPSVSTTPAQLKEGLVKTTWDCRASTEDMEEMWNHPLVSKEWIKSGVKRGKVQISHDIEKRPYISRAELRAVADIVISKHFDTKGIKPIVCCALVEIISFRFLNGVGRRTGLMGIDYPTACCLYKNMGYMAYTVKSVDDLTKPFVSIYFGAAYLAWLTVYDGRERSLKFVVQAYLVRPKKANDETYPLWLRFEEALSRYKDKKKKPKSCIIF